MEDDFENDNGSRSWTPPLRVSNASNASLASLGSLSVQSFQSDSQIGVLPEIIHVKRRIGELAMNFDPQRSGVLRGFDGASLGPSEFKEQMRRNFGMYLTPEELGAMITWFDKDGDGTVDCGEFLSEFFRLGRELRRKQKLQLDRVHAKHIEDRKKIEAEKARKRTELLQVAVKKDFTEKERASALAKVARVAKHFDRRKNPHAMKAFVEGGAMDPATFKQTLWRNLSITVTAGELGALMAEFDQDGDGTVDADEFIFRFFQIGRDARADAHRAKLDLDHRLREKERQFTRGVEEKYARLAEARPREPRPGKDLESAIAKVAKVARLYDRDRGFNLMSFRGTMDLTKFKEQLKVLGVLCTPAELTALMREFDHDGDGTVDCAEFLAMFFRIGRREKTAFVERQRAEHRRRAEAERRRKREQVERFAKMKEARVVWPKPLTHATAYFAHTLKEHSYVSLTDPAGFARSLRPDPYDPLAAAVPVQLAQGGGAPEEELGGAEDGLGPGGAGGDGAASAGLRGSLASWSGLSQGSGVPRELRRVTRGTTDFLKELEREEIRISKMRLKPLPGGPPDPAGRRRRRGKKKGKRRARGSEGGGEEGEEGYYGDTFGGEAGAALLMRQSRSQGALLGSAAAGSALGAVREDEEGGAGGRAANQDEGGGEEEGQPDGGAA